MNEPINERRLAAILAADMVGYSRLMEANEEGTLRALNALLDRAIKPLISKHHGRVVKLTGDGLLAEFSSVLNAIRCAIDIQKNLIDNPDANLDQEHILFRIGINSGDIIIQNDDVFGAGVNVAARLEAIAEPGGICLSRPVFDQVKNLVKVGFVYLGEYQAKNIVDPIHAYRVNFDAPSGTVSKTPEPEGRVLVRAKGKHATKLRGPTLVFVAAVIVAVIVGISTLFMIEKMPEERSTAGVPSPVQSPQPDLAEPVVAEINPPPESSLVPGVSFRDCNFCPEMIVIPAGTFVMGDESRRDTSPPIEVLIDQPFAIGKFEITFAQWDACSMGGGCGTYSPSDSDWGRGKRPVINISWKDAQAYVFWLSRRAGKTYRLPSEAEWEYTARAGSSERFPWGNEIDRNLANYGTQYEETLPVGSFKPNTFGLYDVIGNVSEWVSDCYQPDSYQSHDSYPAPVGSSNDTCARVLRGSSWTSRSLPELVQTSRRLSGSADGRYKFNGMRVLRVID